MKSNIFIIIIVTLAALGVVALVIILSRPADGGASMSGSSESAQSSVYTANSSDGGVSYIESNTSRPQQPDVPPNALAQSIVSMASSLVNAPYAENGTTPEGFDNSGLIYYIMRENGFMTCPRWTEDQAEWGTKLGYNSVRPGDLVFFYNDGDDEEKAGFGGIYIGNGEMVACITRKEDTKVWLVDITTDYYREHFVHGIATS